MSFCLESVYDFTYTNCMSQITIEQIKVNLPKFRQVRGGKTLKEYSAITGINADMLSKIERGERWTTLNAFAEFCRRTNQEPNAFFEIVKKIS